MKVQWIVEGVTGNADVGYASSLASNRYRAILPGQALLDLGHEVTFVPLPTWDPAAQTINRADVVLIGKVAPGGDPQRVAQYCDRVLSGIEVLRKAGVPVVADVNDDHFDRPDVGRYWRELVRLSRLVVVGSDTMQQRVATLTSQPVMVIGDPVASPPGPVRVWAQQGASRWLRWAKSSPPPLQLVWYGHLVNWEPMQRWLEALAGWSVEQPWHLSVVTTPDPALLTFVDAFNMRAGACAQVELVPWSEEAQWQRVARADAVLVPSDVSQSRKVVKTANRLTDALHAGRFVVASPLPAYQPYRDHVALTNDPVASLRDYLQAPQAWRDRIERGAQRVAEALSPLVIAEQWQEAFVNAGGQVAAPFSPELASADGSAQGKRTPSDGLVRLNLGCGDKILPGYVNVDVVAARAGKSPDVICDLHRLHPFQDNSADEVMAIHVVEHFWRWEVEEVLREWLRVLKPGGRMVLECPNLLTACQELLSDPIQKAKADGSGQRSMWVFYGDPAWRDPLMIHRWGYTPQSLAELMQAVGLVDVRQEPAHYKLREPRDMRLVGFKLQ